jgi:single-stranded-DNA-specific exonuclease
MDYELLNQPPHTFLKQHPAVHSIIATLLYQRGIKTRKEIKEFLDPVYGKKQYSPFKFKEMRTVVKRILKAAQHKERVLVYGDYDVDGVCSALLMIETLERLYHETCNPPIRRAGMKHETSIQVYLPHREKEGYGLNPQAVEYIKKKKIKLVITCDCGTTNIKELEMLAKSKVDVIILDHHVAPKKRPPVLAFINPKYKRDSYPFSQLSAGGVVFKVIQALRRHLSEKCERPAIGEGFEKWSLDLVALSTVADVMPLLRENRILVKWGLVVLNKTRRCGLSALIKAARLPAGRYGLAKKINTYEIGYIISPRINAAGRLDHAKVAYNLLRQTVKTKAMEQALNLNKTNERRQRLTEKIFKLCRRQIESQLKNNDRILVAYNLKDNQWPTGILGLAAGKLSNQFNRPSFVIGQASHGLAGSGRSISGFDMMAALGQAKDLFSKYGGHPQACGITFIEPSSAYVGAKSRKGLIDQFKKRIEKYARQKLKDKDLIPKTKVSLELKLADITWDLIRSINQLEPFGQANPKPVFLSRAVKVLSVRLLGSKGDHIKLSIEQGHSIKEAIAFRCAPHIKSIKRGDIIDIIYNIEINEWQGRRSIQLVIHSPKS